MTFRKRFIVVFISGLFSLSLFAAEKKKNRKVRNEQFSTSFDFEESVLQGKMKQPAQVLLKGRRDASKGQIIELRKHFRNELRNSSPGVLRHSR